MIVEDDYIVFDSQIILNCVRNNEYVANNLERLVEMLCDSFNRQNHANYGEILDNIFREVKKPFDYNPLLSEMRKPFDYGPILHYLKNEKDVTRMELISKLSEMKGVESQDVKYIVNESVQKLLDYIRDSKDINLRDIEKMIKENIDNDRLKGLEEKVEKISILRSSTKKGQDGEKDIFEMLSERLPSRNGYSIKSVRGIKGYCDIEIACKGYNNIYVDVKNYESGGKIKTDEIEKFIRDLIGLNSSGIMCSLWSGIVSKNQFQCEQLPNGKFAFYLSNVANDSDIILEVVYLIHQLERMTSTDEGNVQIHPDTLQSIRDIVLQNMQKISCIKTQMTSSLKLLSELNINTINQLIMNPNSVSNNTEREIVSESDKKCPTCLKEFSTRYKCKQHMDKKVCDQKVVNL